MTLRKPLALLHRQHHPLHYNVLAAKVASLKTSLFPMPIAFDRHLLYTISHDLLTSQARGNYLIIFRRMKGYFTVERQGRIDLFTHRFTFIPHATPVTKPPELLRINCTARSSCLSKNCRVFFLRVFSH